MRLVVDPHDAVITGLVIDEVVGQGVNVKRRTRINDEPSFGRAALVLRLKRSRSTEEGFGAALLAPVMLMRVISYLSDVQESASRERRRVAMES